MSRTETQVEKVEDRAERVIEHTQELDEIRRQKLDQHEQKEAHQEEDQDEHVLTGWIRNARKEYGAYVLEVEVQDGAETVTEEFRLDWPDDPDEATIENEVITLAHLVGDSDGLDDILEQEVPILKTGDESYQLDLPEKPTLTHRAGKWTLRRLIEHGFIEVRGYGYEPHPTALTGGTTVASILALFLGFLPIYTFITAFSNPADGFLVATLGSIAISIGWVFFCAPFHNERATEFWEDPANRVLSLGGVIAVVAAIAFSVVTLLGAVPPIPERILTGFAYSPALIGGLMFIIAGTIGTAYTGKRVGQRAYGVISRAFSGTVDWVRRRRGVDYLR